MKKGFDFLGQNVRRYPNGKLLIKPSKKNFKTFLDGIRQTIRNARGMSAADLIDLLNPKIRGWANYHRHVVSSRIFSSVDHSIFYKSVAMGTREASEEKLTLAQREIL